MRIELIFESLHQTPQFNRINKPKISIVPKQCPDNGMIWSAVMLQWHGVLCECVRVFDVIYDSTTIQSVSQPASVTKGLNSQFYQMKSWTLHSVIAVSV